MGHKLDGYSLSVRMAAPVDQHGSWLSGDLVPRALLAPLAELVLPRCTHFAEDMGDPQPIVSQAALLERSRGWRYNTYEMMSGASPKDPDCYVNFWLAVDAAWLSVGIGGSALVDLGPRLVSLATSWVLAWSRGASPVLHLAYGAFWPRWGDTPRQAAARTSPVYHLDSLVQFTGITWHGERPERQSVLNGVMTAPLPAGAHRSTEGDVVVVRFLDELADPIRIRHARAAHEAWLAPLCSAGPPRGWNAQGDRIVIPLDVEPRAPLTLYDTELQIGYKAIVVQRDGGIDEALWAELVALAGAGALPDGAPLRSLRLIVPAREDAVAIHARAIAAGFEMVAYPVGDVFWEIEPKGSSDVAG